MACPPLPPKPLQRRLEYRSTSLENISNAKGEYLAATVQKKGRAASEILAELLPKEIAGIYWAKSMYWRGKSAERFVRPLRWMVSLLDAQVVPVEFGGITAGHTSEGHRILSSGAVEIDRPANYAAALAKNFVTATSAEREHTHPQSSRRRHPHRSRRALARRQVRCSTPSSTSPNARASSSAASIPNSSPCPQEVLVTVMRDHQKYFALEDADGKLSPHFLAVLNTDSDPDGLIRHGNERVLRARFNDARFFWNTDQKISLRDRVEMLKSVTFQKDLGSYFDKTMRVQKLGSLISAHPRDRRSRRSVPASCTRPRCSAKPTSPLTLSRNSPNSRASSVDSTPRCRTSIRILPPPTAEAIGDAIYHHYQPESMDDAVPPTI